MLISASLTLRSCLMAAYDVFLDDETDQKTCQAIETAYDTHYYHSVPEYKSGGVSERTNKVYEPWFQLLHGDRSGLDNAI